MRAVIFTDVSSVTTARLIRAMLRLAVEQAEWSVVGVVTTRPLAFRSGAASRVAALSRDAVIALSNPEVSLRTVGESDLNLFRLARRHEIPVLVPPAGDVNAPEFIREMSAELRPDVALSFYCQHRFRRRLRSSFARAVNYHDGLLPHYRGVMATPFSIFAGESESGFTFHDMSGKIDRGPILVQGSVTIDEHATLHEVSRRKSVRAAAALPRVLELLADGTPGRPQCGEGSCFSTQDWMALTRLSRPANATREEILRRIRAFGVVHLTIGGEVYPATRLRLARPDDRLAFRTADGCLLRPDRFLRLPEVFYRHHGRITAS